MLFWLQSLGVKDISTGLWIKMGADILLHTTENLGSIIPGLDTERAKLISKSQ